ncbi:hypothetical protein PYCCODRAFT_720025 [Trametes coccinea BRFM310]|uniref:Uncharacterized protein n=1 Tax=Trametes coccinea (strain BRFM310) TaxID=1353009 RepID=A0A1Y2IGA2_TRAC3|nr:hypothetical protein PYCCODRAFT_720025 [Trametes coccinea BRFM310]
MGVMGMPDLDWLEMTVVKLFYGGIDGRARPRARVAESEWLRPLDSSLLLLLLLPPVLLLLLLCECCCPRRGSVSAPLSLSSHHKPWYRCFLPHKIFACPILWPSSASFVISLLITSHRLPAQLPQDSLPLPASPSWTGRAYLLVYIPFQSTVLTAITSSAILLSRTLRPATTSRPDPRRRLRNSSTTNNNNTNNTNSLSITNKNTSTPLPILSTATALLHSTSITRSTRTKLTIRAPTVVSPTRVCSPRRLPSLADTRHPETLRRPPRPRLLPTNATSTTA